MLAQVLIAEADSFVAVWKDLKLRDGRDRVVRHGHGPHRAIQTGVGPVEVRRAKVHDRGDAGAEENPLHLVDPAEVGTADEESRCAVAGSLLAWGVDRRLPKGAHRPPWQGRAELSPAVITRLTAEWQADYDASQKRDLSARRYVYEWVDGVYPQARMEEAAECLLVLIGATPEGKKELVGFQTGVRECAQSWRELLVDIKQRGREIAPDLAVGDGSRRGLSGHQASALLGSQDHQRAEQSCPLGSAQHEGRPSRDLRRAYPRSGRSGDRRVRRQIPRQVRQGDRLPDEGSRSASRLLRLPRRALGPSAYVKPDRERVRHGAASNREDQGALSAKTAKLMVFKLVNAAAKTWRRLKGENQLPKVVQGVKFKNGIEVIKMPAHHAA